MRNIRGANIRLGTALGTIALFTMLLAHSSFAEHWPNWRGPQHRGTTDVADAPIDWDGETNIRWAFDLPGPGSSTPIVWDQNIFLTSQDGEQNAVVCLKTDGSLQWTTNVGSYRKGKHGKATGANPSPVTDGKHVYCYFKSGDLACLDFSGRIVWQHNLQQEVAADNLWWDLGTSPVLSESLVIVACMQTGDSYLIAYDKLTGAKAWQVDRNLSAPLESNQSYTTPCVVNVDGSERLIVLGADHFTAHDLQDGHELWRVGDLNPDQHKMFRSISSPVASETTVFGCYARGNSLTAIRLGGSGDVTDTHVAWRRSGNFADVPTPALRENHLLVLTDKGLVMCLQANNGDLVWQQQLKSRRSGFSASPIAAGNRLYIISEKGVTYVLDLENEGTLLATNELDEPVVATPVFTTNNILIRTVNRLVCVGRP